MLGLTKRYKLSPMPVVIYKYIMSNKSSPDDAQKYEGAGTGVPGSWKFGSKTVFGQICCLWFSCVLLGRSMYSVCVCMRACVRVYVCVYIASLHKLFMQVS